MERGTASLEVEKMYAAEAAKKKVEAGKQFGKGHPKVTADLREANPHEHEARTKAARLMDVSPRTSGAR